MFNFLGFLIRGGFCFGFLFFSFDKKHSVILFEFALTLFLYILLKSFLFIFLFILFTLILLLSNVIELMYLE